MSESLLPSVLYFVNKGFNCLSDPAQIKVILKCNIKKENKRPYVKSDWSQVQGYKWSPESSIKILNALSNDSIRTKILDYEGMVFSEDQEGVHEATGILNNIFCDIADQSCKKVKTKKRKKKIIKQKWSDFSIYEQKKNLNWICSQIKGDPYNKSIHHKYFIHLK